MKEAKAGAPVGTLLMWVFFGGLTYLADSPPAATVAAGVVVIVTMPCWCLFGIGISLPMWVAGAVLSDKAGRLAESIRTCPRPVPANDIINGIRALHAAVATASAGLGPIIILHLAGGVTGVIIWLILALGPGPPADHWLSADLHYRTVFLVVALMWAVNSLRETFRGPAMITAACDEVAVELNDLRSTADGLAAEPVLAEVEALERYVDKIGLGFDFFHFRISYAVLCVTASTLYACKASFRI